MPQGCIRCPSGEECILFAPLILYFKSYSLFGHSWVFSETFDPFLTFVGSPTTLSKKHSCRQWLWGSGTAWVVSWLWVVGSLFLCIFVYKNTRVILGFLSSVARISCIWKGDFFGWYGICTLENSRSPFHQHRIPGPSCVFSGVGLESSLLCSLCA